MKTSRAARLIASFSITAAACLSPLFPALAGGSEAGNGAGGFVLPDGEVVLADPYFVRVGSCKGPERFPEPLTKMILGAGKLLNHFGADDGEKFMREEVLSPLVEYCFMDQLPASCKHDSNEDYTTPEGGKFVNLACTTGKRTFIKADLFERMNLREQAKLVIHERLHDVAPSAPHDHINSLTDATDAMLIAAQADQQGGFLTLDRNQAEVLERAPILIAQLGVRSVAGTDLGSYAEHFNSHRIWKRGGGWVSRAITVDPTSYIGIGSMISASSGKVHAETEIRRSRLNSRDMKTRVLNGSRIMDSRIELLRKYEKEGCKRQGIIADKNIEIRKSTVVAEGGRTLFIGKKVKVSDSTIESNYLGEASLIERSNLQRTQLGGRNHVSRVSSEMSLYLDKGAGLTRSDLQCVLTPPNKLATCYAQLSSNASLTNSSVRLFDYPMGNTAKLELGPSAKIENSTFTLAGEVVNHGVIRNTSIATFDCVRCIFPDKTFDHGFATIRLDRGAFIEDSTLLGIENFRLNKGARLRSSTLASIYLQSGAPGYKKDMEKLARLSVSNPTSFSLGANASITGLGDGWYFGLYPASFFSYDIEAPSIEVESGTHLNFSLTGKACRPGEVLRIHGKNSVSSVRAFQKLCEDYPDEEMWLDYLGYPW